MRSCRDDEFCTTDGLLRCGRTTTRCFRRSLQFRHAPCTNHRRATASDSFALQATWNIAPVVFGSVARGEWDPSQSDVDFLVEFSPDRLPADQLLGLYAGLTEMFPCHIDLVSMRAVKNKLFRLELGETRVTLYAAA